MGRGGGDMGKGTGVRGGSGTEGKGRAVKGGGGFRGGRLQQAEACPAGCSQNLKRVSLDFVFITLTVLVAVIMMAVIIIKYDCKA